MEDIRIARKSYATESQVVVAATETPLVGPAPTRIGLQIYPVATNTIFISSTPGVVPTNGIRINDATGPLIMDYITHAAFVKKGFVAAIPAGTGTVTIVEVLLNEE